MRIDQAKPSQKLPAARTESRRVDHSKLQPPFAWLLDRNMQLNVGNQAGTSNVNIAPLSIDLSVGGRRLLGASQDGRFVIAVNAYDAQDQLVRYDIDGTKSWSFKTGQYVAVDLSANGFAYVIKQRRKGESGEKLLKVAVETGKIEREVALPGRYFDVVVDDRNEVIWVAGGSVARYDLNLEQLWYGNPVPFWIVSIDVAPDGSLFAAERGRTDLQSPNQLLRFQAGSGEPQRIPLDFSPSHVDASGRYWDIWVSGFSGTVEKGVLVRLNPKAGSDEDRWTERFRMKADGASYVVAWRDGTAWLARHSGLTQVDRDGSIVRQIDGWVKGSACIALAEGYPAFGASKRAAEKPEATGDHAAPAPSQGQVPADRRVMSLVISDKGGQLAVVGASEMDRAELGPPDTWNPRGQPTHRWAVRNGAGDLLSSGDIAVRQVIEAPPGARGEPALAVPAAEAAFTLRVPFPDGAKFVEIARSASGSKSVRWQP